MWVWTEQGEMYSAVNYKNVKSVRTRDERSAVRLAEFVEPLRGEPVPITVGAGYDYEWRVTLSKEEWKAFMNDRIDTAEATNVKSTVARNIGYEDGKKFLDAMHDTWTIWFDYQQDQLGKRTFRMEEPELELDEIEEDWEELTEDDEAWSSYHLWSRREKD